MIKKLLQNIACVTRASETLPISGKVNTAMPRGIMVYRNPTNAVQPQGVDQIAPSFELVLADTTSGSAGINLRPYFLERQVMLTADYVAYMNGVRRRLPDEEAHFAGEIEPVEQGTEVAGRQFEEVDVEGALHLDASVTGALAGGTKLCLKQGKWALESANASSTTAGYIVASLTPKVAGNFRYKIQVVR
jgi:hypothetical protein